MDSQTDSTRRGVILQFDRTDCEHKATLLPEIVRHILAYLPEKTDLLACTKLNRVWETEARKYLLNLPLSTSTPLCCRNILSYLSTTGVRGQFHTQFHLHPCNTLTSTCLQSLIQTPFSNPFWSSRVTRLSTEWILTDSRWGKDFVSWSNHFPNVATLQLRPTHGPLSYVLGFPEDNRDQISQLVNLIQEFDALTQGSHPFTWPSLKTLCIRVPQADKVEARYPDWLLRFGVAPRILNLFRHVTSLQFWNVGGEMIRGIGEHYSNLSSLSICQLRRPQSFGLPPADLAEAMGSICLLGNLTIFEFNLSLEIEIPVWEGILNRVSHTVEQLCIRDVRSIFKSDPNHKVRSLLVPILPRVKVFRIMRSTPYSDSWTGCDCETAVPQVELVFETGSGPGRILHYPTQFPVLKRLEIGREEDPSFGAEVSGDESYFETGIIPFLYSSFLPPSHNHDPCETLRFLEIPIPSRPEVQDEEKECKCCERTNDSSSCGRGRSSLAKFYYRIGRMFPNLGNNLIFSKEREIAEENEREEKNRKFVALGNELGLL